MKRLTPMDIFNKDFKHVMRGYDIEEVNHFLDVVIRNYEQLIQENEQLKEQISLLKKNQNNTTSRQSSNQGDYDEVIHDILRRLDRIEQHFRR
ncbi:DivIVA domain-containing protein [Hazenella sp. IB182357]|uniref:DivIVA domain-containing protein n=1 Tax=Polycladospora coralii TaxID=2771432 RepID=A0A926N5T4_9BACL|nr:DivIVA domain-containing protein [Polycladospora coralii]MBD1371201.1 DivIVA domain-containing protein [Polycladospora coralii]MBS7530143.1 DivIVA domain-containing protein [Polycladospora coralii]